MEERKKVTFTLEGSNMSNFEKLGIHDYDPDEEREKAMKKRTGFVHKWGVINGERVLAYGIVEDCEDGQVYCIPLENIKFEH